MKFAEGMGAPSVSAILTWTEIATKEKPALIAIGREPDLLFNMNVKDLRNQTRK